MDSQRKIKWEALQSTAMNIVNDAIKKEKTNKKIGRHWTEEWGKKNSIEKKNDERAFFHRQFQWKH